MMLGRLKVFCLLFVAVFMISSVPLVSAAEYSDDNNSFYKSVEQGTLFKLKLPEINSTNETQQYWLCTCDPEFFKVYATSSADSFVIEPLKEGYKTIIMQLIEVSADYHGNIIRTIEYHIAINPQD